MSEESAPVADAVSYAVPADAPAAMSVSDAARMLSQARRKSAESAPEAPAEPELVQETNAAAETHPGEAEGAVDQEETLPPIDAPKSWAKEARDRFHSYPREAQEEFARIAQEREREFLRGHQEAAEAKRALDAQMAQAEEIRKQYEAKLPSLTKTIEAALQNEFGDIQSIPDVRKMQAEDPFRFQAWQIRQMELASAQKEEQEAEHRQNGERTQNLLKYQAEETKRLKEFVPEIEDPAKLEALTKKAITHLKSFDLTDEQLNGYATQGDKPFIYTAAFQRILLNSLKYEEAQKAPAKAAPKSLPPVSRPGTAKGGNPSAALQIQTLTSQLSQASGTQALKLAAELTRLKRNAS